MAWVEKRVLIEDGVPEIAQACRLGHRLGHRLGGVRGIYSHVTEAMQQQLVDALQRRWDNLQGSGPTTPVRRLRSVA